MTSISFYESPSIRVTGPQLGVLIGLNAIERDYDGKYRPLWTHAEITKYIKRWLS